MVPQLQSDPAGADFAEESSTTRMSHTVPPVLLQYWAVVRRWKHVMIGIVVAALVAGLVITLLTTPTYTATSRIEVSRNEKNITEIEGVESAKNATDTEFYQTQYSLLEARSLAKRVVRQLRLAESDEFFDADFFTSKPLLKAYRAVDESRYSLPMLINILNGVRHICP